MPLFKNNPNTTTAATTEYPAGTGPGHTTNPGGPLHPGTAFASGQGHTGMNQPNHPTGAPYNNTAQTGAYGQGTMDPTQMDNYGHTGTAGPYTSAGVGHHGQATTGIPPTGALNDPAHSHGSAPGQRAAGVVESAIGSLVCSDTLKAKGLQKQREADAYGVQARELSEAERLENEAGMRRDRAVAHGAHPANKHLGGGLHN